MPESYRAYSRMPDPAPCGYSSFSEYIPLFIPVSSWMCPLGYLHLGIGVGMMQQATIIFPRNLNPSEVDMIQSPRISVRDRRHAELDSALLAN